MANPNQYGSFVPTNFIWDMKIIKDKPIDSKEFKEVLLRLYENIGLMALVLNTKDTGFFVTSEFVTGQQYFQNPAYNSSTAIKPTLRQVRRKVIYYTTPLPNTGTVAIPHGITCTAATTFVTQYASANDVTGFNYINLPYASPTLVNNIEFNVDGTNVNITTGSNRTNFTKTYIVLEWLQN